MIVFSSNAHLSDEARRLVDFDIQSIERLVAAERTGEPDAWLADPDGYQEDGHVRRDSDLIRLVAYARHAGVIYSTDGCNACRHSLERPLEAANDAELENVSRLTQLPLAMLRKIVEIAEP